MSARNKLAIALMLGAATLAAAPAAISTAWAMGSSNPAPAAAPADPDYAAGRAAIEKKDWPAAIDSLKKVVARDGKNADAFNYLGYAQRNAGDLDNALVAYAKALEIDPKHRGAHEYMGEAYLMQKNLPKAEELLARLDKICTFGCAEYRELKAKVAEYKKQHSG
ncbi:tetratricopeptide repeat protein [Desertibaculum subflavum]|uniref:tetratricopeptide repeat protein n=1 Tax=Desertibaculum subflavum TaxID=2268458 RepID=UPI0013C52482